MDNEVLITAGTNKILECFENYRLELLGMLKVLISSLDNQSIDVNIVLINKESERFVDEYIISRIFIKDDILFYNIYQSQEDIDEQQINPESENMFDFCSMDELFEILINLQKKYITI